MDLNADIEWAKVFAWVVGAFTGLLAWAGNRQVARVDKHDARLDQHDKRFDQNERTVAQKSDLVDMEKRLASQINTVASHIAERLGDVKATADKAHDRIDSISKSPPH